MEASRGTVIAPLPPVPEHQTENLYARLLGLLDPNAFSGECIRIPYGIPTRTPDSESTLSRAACAAAMVVSSSLPFLGSSDSIWASAPAASSALGIHRCVQRRRTAAFSGRCAMA